MEMKNLNPTLKPLANMELVSGQMRRIQFHMNAGPVQSRNKLIFDYSDLHVKLITENSKNKATKKVLPSAIDNGAIRPNNLPDLKKYLVAEYQSKRNDYRSPIVSLRASTSSLWYLKVLALLFKYSEQL